MWISLAVVICCLCIGKVAPAAHYVGCYASFRPGLDGATMRSASNTPDNCIATCEDMGYKLAGVENGLLCNCGNTNVTYVEGGVKACSKPCPGDASQECGGEDRQAIYSTATKSKTGCFIDKSPALPFALIVNSGNTPEFCTKYCEDKGFKFAGVQMGYECYCGHKLYDSRKTAEVSCDTPCAGNAAQMCGSETRQGIYRTGI
ncbi:hypothetical protein ScPMuIL_002477 [Solemya velum]